MYNQGPANKNPKYSWDEYETNEREPNLHSLHDLSPEDEAEILDKSYFLKARVRRNMRRIRNEYVDHDEPKSLRHWHRPHRFKHA